MVYHTEKRKDVIGNSSTLKVVENGPLRVAFSISYDISSHSSIKHVVSLDAISPLLTFDTRLDWHENRKFLKVEFPFNIRSPNATYSIQFGNIQRSTRANTTWEIAKYEVCAHHWADLSEYGFGVTLLNDSKYGYSVAENVMRLSLVRAPKSPDLNADMGKHRFKYALLLHGGDFRDADVPRMGYNFNVPLQVAISSGDVNASYFGVDSPNIILESVKKAEDSNKHLIVRLWECFGGRGHVKLSSLLSIKSAIYTNLIEEEDKSQGLLKWSNGNVTVPFKPFQIITIKLELT